MFLQVGRKLRKKKKQICIIKYNKIKSNKSEIQKTNKSQKSKRQTKSCFAQIDISKPENVMTNNYMISASLYQRK